MRIKELSCILDSETESESTSEGSGKEGDSKQSPPTTAKVTVNLKGTGKFAVDVL